MNGARHHVSQAARRHPPQEELFKHYPEFSSLLKARLNQQVPREDEARANLLEQVMTSPGDDADASVLDESADYFLKLANDSKAEIQAIQEALDRISHGVYGICDECDLPISIERLRRLPTARLCIDCQGAVERVTRGMRPSARPRL